MKFEKAGSRFPYNLADTFAGPEIRIPDNGTLELQFRDYREELVSLVFDDVLGVKYQSVACDESGLAEDQAIEVIDSAWLSQTCQAAKLDPREYRHLIIGFYERSIVLEVLFKTLEEADNLKNPSA